VSQEINLRRDSDDNGEWAYPNTAPIPSLPLSRKRPLESEEVSNDSCPRNESSPENKTVTGSTDFAIGLELADEVKAVSPHNRKRRGVVKVERSEKNDAAGECALGDWVTRQRLQYRKHLEHLEGKTSRMTTFRIQALESLDFDWGLTAREDYFSELADYQKIHGHCNVPKSYSENTKLTDWVAAQRETYRLHLEGKTSPMTPFFIQELECLGFEWDSWEDRFSELADFREIHGHCSVLKSNSDNSMLNNWAETQRKQYRKH
jgi:hypothetical protein